VQVAASNISAAKQLSLHHVVAKALRRARPGRFGVLNAPASGHWQAAMWPKKRECHVPAAGDAPPSEQLMSGREGKFCGDVL